VNVDAVIRTLLTRGLVAEVGIERETGAILYATTEHFLERLGLASIDDLPPLSEYLPDHTVLDDDAAIG
jgi:segregation and condensation protein B